MLEEFKGDIKNLTKTIDLYGEKTYSSILEKRNNLKIILCFDSTTVLSDILMFHSNSSNLPKAIFFIRYNFQDICIYGSKRETRCVSPAIPRKNGLDGVPSMSQVVSQWTDAGMKYDKELQRRQQYLIPSKLINGCWTWIASLMPNCFLGVVASTNKHIEIS